MNSVKIVPVMVSGTVQSVSYTQSKDKTGNSLLSVKVSYTKTPKSSTYVKTLNRLPFGWGNGEPPTP